MFYPLLITSWYLPWYPVKIWSRYISLIVQKAYTRAVNIRFVENLIRDIHCNFYDDDLIIVTSLVLRTQSVSEVFAQQFFYNSQVLDIIVSYEEREQVQ